MLARRLFLLAFVLAAAKSECPADWTLSIHTEKCVKPFTEKMSFFDAQEFCEAQGSGGSLVSIHNSFQNAQLGSLALKMIDTCSFWIGFYDFDGSNTYQWIDSSDVDYLNWAEGFPAGNPEDTAAFMSMELHNRWEETNDLYALNCFFCQQNAKTVPVTTTVAVPTKVPITTTEVEVVTTTTAVATVPVITTTTTPLPTTTSYFYDATCSYGWVFYNHHCYFFSTWAQTLSQAQSYCKWTATGGAMASVLSEDETDFMLQNTAATSEYWIGLTETSKTWKWDDGSVFDYTNWGDGFPTDSVKFRCGAMFGNDGTWENVDCTAPSLMFICKQKV